MLTASTVTPSPYPEFVPCLPTLTTRMTMQFVAFAIVMAFEASTWCNREVFDLRLQSISCEVITILAAFSAINNCTNDMLYPWTHWHEMNNRETHQQPADKDFISRWSIFLSV